MQMASRNEWVGGFRLVGGASSNLIIEKGKNVSKWPKYKTRLIATRPEDGMGKVTPPTHPASESEEGNASAL